MRQKENKKWHSIYNVNIHTHMPMKKEKNRIISKQFSFWEMNFEATLCFSARFIFKQLLDEDEMRTELKAMEEHPIKANLIIILSG